LLNFKQIFTPAAAGRTLQVALVLLAIFHVGTLAGVVPAEIVLGGQIIDSTELIIKEAIALFVTLMFLLVVTLRLRDIRMRLDRRGPRIGVWIIAAYFAVNLIGNLASGVAAENTIFAPITVILAILALRTGLNK